MTDGVRVVHLGPEVFRDVEEETTVFERAFEDVSVELLWEDGTDDLDQLGPIDFLLTAGSPVGAEMMDVADPAVIAVYQTGFDNVDVAAATERGIAVTRVPKYCDREVGEHTLTLALALLRGLPKYSAETRNGGWDWRVANPLYTWDQLTFGFLAFGRKARATATLASALDFDLLAYDPYLDDDEIRDAGPTPVGFESLLAETDVLSVHVPLTPETEGIIDGEAFSRMKDGAVIVNTSRGGVIDEPALVDSLENGPLAGAALDVLAEEPPESDHPLLHRDDVIVTPHAAWNSEGAAQRLRRQGTEKAIAAYRGQKVDGVVNPEVFDEE